MQQKPEAIQPFPGFGRASRVETLHKLTPLEPGLNAYTFTFADELLEDIRTAYRQDLADFLMAPEHQHYLEGGFYHHLPVGPLGDYQLISYDTYPLLWISNHSARTYRLFYRFFEKLRIEDDLRKLVDCRKKIVMYCGFLVVGKQAEEPLFHYDYRPGANAFTLITPLFEWDSRHGRLLYQLDNQTQKTYSYVHNQAIVFGEGFLHSTEPYPPGESLRVLVSLTFGTDQFKYWDILSANIAEQSCYYAQPCGHIVNTCLCQWRYRLGCQLRQWLQP